MALMEVLIAGAVLAAAMLAFLAVLTEAHADLAHARRNAEAAALAQAILREARSHWARGPYSGERSGFSWTLACAAPPEASSPRLVLVQCSATITGNGLGAPRRFKTAWAAPRAHIFSPP
jgi:hypothetical protein